MSSFFIKFDLETEKIKYEEVEQYEALIRISNSNLTIKDELFDKIKISSKQYISIEKIQFEDWINWVFEEKSVLPGLSEKEQKIADDFFWEYDYQLKEELYRPIYDLSCSTPKLIAPNWWL